MIYLDNAATTKVSAGALKTMTSCLEELCGNPSAVHTAGARSRQAMERARREAAAVIGAEEGEIFFTSGGTESDNWALISVFEARRDRGNHIVASAVEHHAVLRTCEYLKSRGAEITLVRPGEDGAIDPEDVRRAMRPGTILVSVMTANNETGVIQPVRAIADAAHDGGALFHTDAVQAFGHIPLSAEACGADLLSASSHKLNGPAGCGILYIRRGTAVRSLIHGGSQERSRRAGTENVAAIAGFGEAAREARLFMDQRGRAERALRDYLIREVEAAVPGAALVGSRENRLPNNACFLFPGTENQTVLIGLDMRGVAASGGAACSSGSLDPSHVLLAMGYTYEEAFSEIRLTLSHENTREEIDAAVKALAEVVRGIRERR